MTAVHHNGTTQLELEEAALSESSQRCCGSQFLHMWNVNYSCTFKCLFQFIIGIGRISSWCRFWGTVYLWVVGTTCIVTLALILWHVCIDNIITNCCYFKHKQPKRSASERLLVSAFSNHQLSEYRQISLSVHHYWVLMVLSSTICEINSMDTVL